jgi:hypothetical protein
MNADKTDNSYPRLSAFIGGYLFFWLYSRIYG